MNYLRQRKRRLSFITNSTARYRGKESDEFWDWSLLELLVQSGLRIEEASELTTLDILKRHMPDGRVYYMLHVKTLEV